MHISEFLGLSVGHNGLDFIDINLDDDTPLFIDPCLLEGGGDPWSMDATRHMNGYFDSLYLTLRHKWEEATDLLEHAHELNATKLGYGNRHNGKGKTAEGLANSLSELHMLVHGIPTISRAQDLPVLVRRFAEDCMSDLLTNILHAQLNQFTEGQMKKYGREADDEVIFWTWNLERGEWELVRRPVWFYHGREVLLVPKWIVRKNFLFKAHQYLYGVIIERMQREYGWEDLKKIDIWQNIRNHDEDWEYNFVIHYTQEHPGALTEYHDRIPRYYSRAHGHMSDEDLDLAVYGTTIEKTA